MEWSSTDFDLNNRSWLEKLLLAVQPGTWNITLEDCGEFICQILFREFMGCKECGISLTGEAHQDRICFDCYCRMDLAVHEELTKKNDSEEEQVCIPCPTPSHLGEFVHIAGPLTAGVANGM